MGKIINKYFLITTADESTWNKGESIVFLGEWCRKYSRRKFWENLDAKLLEYHWDNHDKYYRDYLNLNDLYEKKLIHLSHCLGQMHGVTQDIRYWRIIIGPWLRFFIDVLFDRFESIRSAQKSVEIAGTWVCSYDLYEWIPSDFQDFYTQYTDDPWNHIVYAECIRLIGIPFTQHHDLSLEIKGTNTSPRVVRRSVQFLLELYARLLPSCFNQTAIISAYMPIKQLCKLQQALGQLPYIKPPSITVISNDTDYHQRELLAQSEAESPFEKLLNKLITKWIPKAYIENFFDLQKSVLAKYPKKPKVIYTANAYQADDSFKIWAAHHAMNGIPLVIGQHGGNMGIARFNQTEDHQVRIADFFTSWGWKKEGYNNVLPMPALKLTEAIPLSDSRGDVLVTIASYPRYFYCHYSVPVAGQYLNYLEDQLKFVRSIDSELQTFLKLRIDHDKYGWDIVERFTHAGVGWAIDREQVSFTKKLNGCRISVSTYNATTFLETLAANFPTIVFFDPKIFEVRSEAEAMINRLREVGILHSTPESAAKLLNSIGNNVDQWWNDSSLQAVRKDFCHQYASVSTDWLNVWRSLFNSLSKKSHY